MGIRLRAATRCSRDARIRRRGRRRTRSPPSIKSELGLDRAASRRPARRARAHRAVPGEGSAEARRGQLHWRQFVPLCEPSITANQASRRCSAVGGDAVESRSFVRRAWPIAATALIAGVVVGAAVRWSRTPGGTSGRPCGFNWCPLMGKGTINGLSRLVGVSPDGTPARLRDRQGSLSAELSAASRLVAGTEQGSRPSPRSHRMDGRSLRVGVRPPAQSRLGRRRTPRSPCVRSSCPSR